MALKVGEGLTAGSSRLTITIKASVETQWCILQMSHQLMGRGGEGGGGARVLLFQSSTPKWLSCSFCTFLQSALSGKIFRCPGLCSLKTHFMDC